MAMNNLRINKIKFEYLLKDIKPVEQFKDKQEITVDIDELTIDEKYKPYIKEFIKKTSANFNFRNPNEKLKTLAIKPKPILLTLMHPTSEASYDIFNNKIYAGKNIDDSIYHELFHAFTSYKKNALSTVSGFNYTNIHANIARRLNEGYTDLLANRYFDSVVSYMIEANIARKTELILGEENMQDLYASNPDVLHQAQTMAFTTLAFSELFHMVGMSDVNRSFVHVFKDKNWMMLVAFAAGIILQLFVIETPGVQELFTTANLSWDEWLITLAFSVIPLVLHEVIVGIRFLKRKFAK